MASEERNSDYIEKLVAVNRVAKVVKGGDNLVSQLLQLLVMDTEELVMVMVKQRKYQQLFKKQWKKLKKVWSPYL
jgi:hypothetical protein